MHPVQGQRSGLVRNGVVSGDRHPHLPVLAERPRAAVEPAQELVHRAPDHHARRLQALAHGDLLEPSRKDPGRALLERPDAGPVARLVDRDVAAERRSRLALVLEQTVHGGVEPVAYAVVPVQEMDEVAARALEAGVEVGYVTNVARLAEE